MLFMNIARKFGAVYQEEASAEGGSPVAAAPAGDPAPVEVAKPAEEAKPDPVTLDKPGEQAPEANELGAKESIAAFSAEYAEGKPALALALGFLGDAGISTSDPAFEQAREGDFTLLKAVLAQKGLPGTDQMLAILEGEVQSSIKEQQDYEAQTTATVQGILGENHEVILDWARENATEEEKTAMNEMLAAGGLYARAAAIMLRDAYGGAEVTKPASNAAEYSQVGSGANAPLTAGEYATAVNELARKMGGDPRGSAEYQQLSARRAAGRKRGI